MIAPSVPIIRSSESSTSSLRQGWAITDMGSMIEGAIVLPGVVRHWPSFSQSFSVFAHYPRC